MELKYERPFSSDGNIQKTETVDIDMSIEKVSHIEITFKSAMAEHLVKSFKIYI